jgi:type II secretory pathway component PulF
MKYYYEAMDATGLEVSGTIEASNEENANILIRKKGLFVTKLKENSKNKYYYEAISALDEEKFGIIEAYDKRLANLDLLNQGFLVTRLQPAKTLSSISEKQVQVIFILTVGLFFGFLLGLLVK